MDRDGPYRHAPWHELAGVAGAGSLQTRSAWRRSLRLPRQERQVDQDSLARWPGHVAVRKAARARPLHLAAGDGWRHFDLDVTTCLHAGRNRLAQSGTLLAAIGCRLSATYRLIR